MLPISAQDVERLTPPDATDIAYLLATPSLLERAAYNRDLHAAGASYPPDSALYEALRGDLRDLGPANLDAMLAAVDLVEAQRSNAPDDDKRVVGELGDFFAGQPGRYADLLSRRLHYVELAPVIAARKFWVGVEGDGAARVPFERRGNATADRSIAALPPLHLQLIGGTIFARMHLTAEEKKASASPSPSDTSPPPSPGVKTRKTAGRGGKSSATSTRKTRG